MVSPGLSPITVAKCISPTRESCCMNTCFLMQPAATAVLSAICNIRVQKRIYMDAGEEVMLIDRLCLL